MPSKMLKRLSMRRFLDTINIDRAKSTTRKVPGDLDIIEKPQLSTLEQLPAELRDLIFCYVVVTDEPITIPTKLIGEYGHKKLQQDLLARREIALHGPITQPAVALVNRIFQSEALPIFYGENTFVLDKCADLAEVIPPLRKWFDLLKRYTRTATEVGARGKPYDSAVHMLHSWMGLTDGRYPDRSSLDKLAEVLGQDHPEVDEMLKRVFKACHADMAQMLAEIPVQEGYPFD
ncbi:hypothetical protein LTR37_016845 [Vermiconidia calcicola]|uniref:Uncharacterized protein n=1 Tax=Vermiconidia calcicola TaxID=1690605 RepID=A0ACC3MN45_9PEZI|nr:hypothetical protein LTR37_016845 [Vermiconidia calcicola]